MSAERRRKYWVQFRIVQSPMIPSPGVPPAVALGEMAVERELPISEPEDLATISSVILNTLVSAKQIDPAKFAQTVVQVIGWTRFEDPSILIAGTQH